MANAVNIGRVIAAIRGDCVYSEEVGFNMGAYIGATLDGVIGDALGRECGTVACIAGHAYLLATGDSIEGGVNTDSDDIDRVAAEFLGIDMDQASALFYDLPPESVLSQVSAADAIATLEALAVTGDVEWMLSPPSFREAA